MPTPLKKTSSQQMYLGVKEGGATVRGDDKVAAKAVEGALGIELLDGEQEGHALATRHLHSDGGVVDAVLLLELNISALVDLELTVHLHAGPGSSEPSASLGSVHTRLFEDMFEPRTCPESPKQPSMCNRTTLKQP